MKTSMSFTRRTGLALAAMACMLVQGQALAQTYPTKPIKAIVPFAPGSATDQIGRAFAQKMSENLGQTIVVENRAGASGMLGADAVAKSAPDGYTLMVTSSGFVISPAMYKKLPFDTEKDFTPVTSLVSLGGVFLVVNASVQGCALWSLAPSARSTIS